MTIKRGVTAAGQYLCDSVPVEDFQDVRLERRLVGSIDISIEYSVEDVHTHTFSWLANSGANALTSIRPSSSGRC
jgi:hypothetical protein